jgi:hypothetical protein
LGFTKVLGGIKVALLGYRRELGMKLLKYFFVMAFLVSVGSLSALATEEGTTTTTSTGEGAGNCVAGVGGLPADRGGGERAGGDVRTGGAAGDTSP